MTSGGLARAGDEIASHSSRGNVFADLGLPDAERLLAEADVRIAAGDCSCTHGHVCRHNNACPRLTSAEAGR